MKKFAMTIIFGFVFICSLFLLACNEETVYVENISMPENIELFKGQSMVVDVDVIPSTSNDYTINFTSSDNNIVEIINSSGNKVRVRGVNYGDAIITCTVTNNSGEKIEDSCIARVTDGEIYAISIDENSLDLVYYEGQTFELGDVDVYVCYQSGVNILLEESEYEIDIPNPLTIGAVLTIYYENFTDEIELNVVEDQLLRIEIVNLPDKLNYMVGETFDSTGLEVESVWASGKREEIKDFTIEDSPLEYEDSSITINYQEFSVDIDITVNTTYRVSDYSQLQGIIDMAQDGESILISGWHNNVNTIYIPASKNLIIIGATDQQVSITPRQDTPAFIITGSEGSLTLNNITFIGGDAETMIDYEQQENDVDLILEDVQFQTL